MNSEKKLGSGDYLVVEEGKVKGGSSKLNS